MIVEDTIHNDDGGSPMAPHDWFDPDWHNVSKVHDWKNYVTDDLKGLWVTFTRSQKRAISVCLQEIADAEEWE